MGSIGYIKCPICGDQHEIDKYDYIYSCIGYIWIENWKYKVNRYMRGEDPNG